MSREDGDDPVGAGEEGADLVLVAAGELVELALDLVQLSHATAAEQHRQRTQHLLDLHTVTGP